MVRGLYTAHTGMVNEQRRLDIISNNLENVATTGYKGESVTSQAFDQVLAIKVRDRSENYNNETIGRMSLGVKTGEVYTDHSQGSVKQTGNTFDLAISGAGFFPISVLNKNGEASIKYTRDGSFKMTSEGFIVDTSGNRLQGLSGDLQVPTNANSIAVDSMGFVTADGEVIDRIELVDFDNYDYLSKFGDNLYDAVDGATAIAAEIGRAHV